MTASPDLPVDRLRRATGFIRVDGRDLCPGCQPEGIRSERPHRSDRPAEL